MRDTWWRPWFVVLVIAACSGGTQPPQDSGAGSQDAAIGEMPSLELLAGDIGGPGNGDGDGSGARFSSPGGVAIDASGNLYVPDSTSGTIRKITPAGSATTLAGARNVSGSADGIAGAARFNAPAGAAMDSAGNLYIADTNNHTIRKITPAGDVTTLAGTPGMPGRTDGPGFAASFHNPAGVAVDSAGNVYVADMSNQAIREITPAGVVSTLAGQSGLVGSGDGPATSATFAFPQGIAVDNADNLYIADTDNDTIRKIAAGVVSTLAGSVEKSGSADGTGGAARFSFPHGVAVDSAGNVFVADGGSIRKITPAGVVTTLAGSGDMSGSADGTGGAARFTFPRGVAVDSTGHVFVADAQTIRKITPAGVVTTLAGAPLLIASADGTGAAARFDNPAGVAVDSAGNFAVADYNNDTIREVTPAGVVTTLAGTARVTGGQDGTGSAAGFNSPDGIAVDSAGNLYVTDRGNADIRKITPAAVVTRAAGNGSIGNTDGNLAVASFLGPAGVAVDSAGNVFIADQPNHTIRLLTPAGIVSTLAGTAAISGSRDGQGHDAQFNSPAGVAVDSVDNVYIADQLNDTIRKMAPGGLVTTLAGSAGTPGTADGTGHAALFNKPSGVAVDAAGNIYVADSMNSAIRKITPAGVTTTLGGVPGVSGIVLGSAPRFASPSALTIVGDSLVITDTNAVLLLRHVVR